MATADRMNAALGSPAPSYFDTYMRGELSDHEARDYGVACAFAKKVDKLELEKLGQELARLIAVRASGGVTEHSLQLVLVQSLHQLRKYSAKAIHNEDRHPFTKDRRRALRRGFTARHNKAVQPDYLSKLLPGETDELLLYRDADFVLCTDTWESKESRLRGDTQVFQDKLMIRQLKGLWRDAEEAVPSDEILIKWATICGTSVPILRRWFSQCTADTGAQLKKKKT